MYVDTSPVGDIVSDTYLFKQFSINFLFSIRVWEWNQKNRGSEGTRQEECFGEYEQIGAGFDGVFERNLGVNAARSLNGGEEGWSRRGVQSVAAIVGHVGQEEKTWCLLDGGQWWGQEEFGAAQVVEGARGEWAWLPQLQRYRQRVLARRQNQCNYYESDHLLV